jgi:hypothetical protein
MQHSVSTRFFLLSFFADGVNAITFASAKPFTAR